jgi:hypothetical protein
MCACDWSWPICIFRQTASSSLFGIGSQQTKCVKQTATPPIPMTNTTNLLKLVRLVWVDNRSIVMLTVDGKEQKYSVWKTEKIRSHSDNNYFISYRWNVLFDVLIRKENVKRIRGWNDGLLTIAWRKDRKNCKFRLEKGMPLKNEIFWHGWLLRYWWLK